MSAENNDSQNDRIQQIKDDPTKALRAPASEKKKQNADPGASEEAKENARTAVRYLGEIHETPKFQVVTTKLKTFPFRLDDVSPHAQDSVVKWVDANDPDVIDLEDEDGFAPTDYEDDPLRAVEA